jgi:hypothetical protein
MNTYQGTANVEAGIYFNRAIWKFESMEEAGRLPGTVEDRFIRVPAVALLVAGPILGLAYAIFLPLIGFLMLGRLIVRKLGEQAEELGLATARIVAPAWQPARAFLGRRKATKVAEPAPPVADAWVEDAKREVARRDENAK